MYAIARRTIYALLLVALLMLHPIAFAQDKAIIIGSKNFTEQYVLSELAKQLLEQYGFNVTIISNLPTIILRSAFENNEIDLYYEYTGTGYSVIYQQPESELFYDSEKLYAWVKQKDAEKNIVWLKLLPFNNTYTIVLPKNIADEHSIYTLSDLSKYMANAKDPLTLGVNPENWERPDGVKQVEKIYNIDFPLNNVRKMDQGLIYIALQQGYIDMGVVTLTDGFILKYNLFVLEDDKQAFPVYNPAPLVRKDVLDKYPEIAPILNQLTQYLTIDAIRYLNAEVQVEHRPVEMVVKEWLQGNGLLLDNNQVSLTPSTQ